MHHYSVQQPTLIYLWGYQIVKPEHPKIITHNHYIIYHAQEILAQLNHPIARINSSKSHYFR
jgi:hypothetical protein